MKALVILLCLIVFGLVLELANVDTTLSLHDAGVSCPLSQGDQC